MTRLLLVLALAAAAQSAQPGSQWHQWRGPSNNGVAVGDAPTTWSDSSNVAWKVEIPGKGHSSPVVWGNRVFVTTAIPTGTAPAPAAAPEGRGRRGGGGPALVEHRFDVIALDRATGKVIWQKTATVATPHEGHHHMYGSFASNSPVTDGKRVYASFGSRGLYVYDMEGKELWKKDFGVQLRMFRGFGEGAAPVLHGDRLIMLMDHEGDSFMAVLDAATGRELWRVARPDGVTNWSTPYVAGHAGKKQIIVSASRRVHSYDFETGAPIWSATGLGQNTIPQPVQHGDLMFVMSGYRNPKLLAVRLGQDGDLTGTDAIVWTQDRGLSYTASPALHDGILYMITDTAMVSAFKTDTGEPLYHQVRLPKPYNIKASPVIAGGKIYYATEEGDVIVAKTGPSFEIIATNTLADQSFVTTPAVDGGEIFLRSRTHLFRIAD
ncbi:MAG TPA: PQQ-binding-like beta-propeller repeat protein [Vicinamibacterales bacterium]|nr:PQQ-binding-like beta-propeller repeat protein [Vicinamibacterales bacterium]